MLKEELNNDGEEVLQMSVLCNSEEGGEQVGCMCCTFHEKRGEGLAHKKKMLRKEKSTLLIGLKSQTSFFF